MKIVIKTQIVQDWGGVCVSQINSYVDPRDAVLGLAQQLGFDIKQLFAKKDKKNDNR